MVSDATSRVMLGCLLVRGGVHIVAHAKALEKLTGVDVGKLLPVPDVGNDRFPEAKRLQAKGLHQILYRFSPDDYREISRIRTGKHPEDGSALRVEDGPPTGSTPPDLLPEPQLTAPLGPDIDIEMFREAAKKLFGSTAGAPA
jgi:Mn-containing catalase